MDRKLSVLQFMGSERVGHGLATEYQHGLGIKMMTEM